jgi:hypothetical protein
LALLSLFSLHAQRHPKFVTHFGGFTKAATAMFVALSSLAGVG